MEEPKITSGTVPYIASEIPDDPRDITPEQWEAMKAVDIRTVDKSQLVDLSTVHIDESLPVRERVLSEESILCPSGQLCCQGEIQRGRAIL